MRRSLALTRIPRIQSRRIHTFPCLLSNSPLPPLPSLGRVSSTSLSTRTVDELDSSSPNAVNPSPPPEQQGPLSRYDALVKAGTLRNDDHQREIVGKLQGLHAELKDYHPPTVPDEVPKAGAGGGGFLSRLFHSGSRGSDQAEDGSTLTIPADAPKGLYLYGSVGTGKSMLMDLFHSTLPPQFQDSRRRVHFHAFMIDVHKRNHAYKLEFGESGDRMGEVARDLAKEARILSFDEFQVTDITDAMILRNLLERLMGYGVVCVMTSNRHPDELYKNGLQRGSFLPCIELIKSRFEVTDLNGDDYRRVPGAIKKVYFKSSDPVEAAEFRKMFEAMTASDPVISNRKIDVWGRKLAVAESSDKVAWFTFADLCGKNLGAADYLEVTKTWGTIFLEGIPKMNLDQKDKARRFITFMDACYESRTKLFLSSETPIAEIFSSEEDLSERSEIDDSARAMIDDLGVVPDAEGVHSSMFTGEEEVFAFKRCISRLTEMGGERWAAFEGAAPGS